MKGRQSLHLGIFELTHGEISSALKPNIDTFKVEYQSLADKMEENPDQNKNHSIDHVVMRMKQTEYCNTTESQSYTRISAPLADNVSFRIDPHML